MKIISTANNSLLAKRIASSLDLEHINCDVEYFSDQEIKVSFNSFIKNSRIAIVHSTTKPVNDSFMELLLVCNTLTNAGASHITLLAPYLCYGRADFINPSQEIGAANFIAKLIEAAGVKRLVTLDLHSTQIEEFFNIEVMHLDSAKLLHNLFQYQDYNDYIIVAPDQGGFTRAANLAQKFKLPLLALTKKRIEDGTCEFTLFKGQMISSEKYLIIDDIIDSGNTICNAAKFLMKNKAKLVNAYVSHGIFGPKAFANIDISPIQKLYISNSITNVVSSKKIEIIDLSTLFAQALSKLI